MQQEFNVYKIQRIFLIPSKDAVCELLSNFMTSAANNNHIHFFCLAPAVRRLYNSRDSRQLVIQRYK